MSSFITCDCVRCKAKRQRGEHLHYMGFAALCLLLGYATLWLVLHAI